MKWFNHLQLLLPLLLYLTASLAPWSSWSLSNTNNLHAKRTMTSCQVEICISTPQNHVIQSFSLSFFRSKPCCYSRGKKWKAAARETGQLSSVQFSSVQWEWVGLDFFWFTVLFRLTQFVETRIGRSVSVIGSFSCRRLAGPANRSILFMKAQRSIWMEWSICHRL